VIKQLIFIVFFCVISILANAQNINDILSKLPERDRQDLDELFHILMNEDHLSYTLFGDKPVSVSGEFTITPYENTLSGLQSGGVFWKKWNVWKQHQDKFSIKNYLFIEEPAYNQPNKSTFIFFINKKAFLEVVDENNNVFNKILGDNLTASQLLEKMETEHKFMSLIHESEILLGILLGYGEHNARLYEQRMKLKRLISVPSLIGQAPLTSEGLSPIQEEYDFLNEQLKSFEDHVYSPLLLPPIHFAADPNDKETKCLKKKYNHLRGQISLLYAHNSNFLELILSQLTSDELEKKFGKE